MQTLNYSLKKRRICRVSKYNSLEFLSVQTWKHKQQSLKSLLGSHINSKIHNTTQKTSA